MTDMFYKVTPRVVLFYQIQPHSLAILIALVTKQCRAQSALHTELITGVASQYIIHPN